MNTLSGNPVLLAVREVAATKVRKLAPPPSAMATLSRREIAALRPTPAPDRDKELARFLRRLDAGTSRWGKR